MNSCYNIIGSIKNVSTTPSVAIGTFIPANTNGLLNCYNNGGTNVYIQIDNTGQKMFINCTNSSHICQPRYTSDGGNTWNVSTMPANFANVASVQLIVSNASLQTILIFVTATSTQSLLPYVSKDYGATFNQYTTSNITGGWGGGNTQAAWAGGVSDDGVYITFCAFQGSATYGIYRCTNGSTTYTLDTFTRIKNTELTIYGCTVSSTGQYQAIACGNTTLNANHQISSDYGATWTIMDPYNSITTNNVKINSTGTIVWSANGGYTGTTAIANCSQYWTGTSSTYSSGWVYNYGQSSWSTQYPDMQLNLDTIDMSSSGKLMTVCCSQFTSGQYNNGWFSTNYGVNWTRVASTYYPTYTNVLFGKAFCSKNGKYLTYLHQNAVYNGIFLITLPTTN